MGKHAAVNRYEKYGDGEKPQLCPRCKQGLVADHGNRKTCGKCGFSEIVNK